MSRFDGKVAIVTGASSGIGRAVAQAFLQEDARVVGIGRDMSRLEPPPAPRGKWWWGRVDLRLPTAAEQVVASTLEQYGRIDVLVNAAGILTWGRTDDTTDEDWHGTLNMNLTVPFKLMRASARHLQSTSGCIVNVSSVNSHRPFAGVAAYNVSKAGLDHLTRTAALEMAPQVRVNAVNPGVVRTQLHRRSGMSEEQYETFMDHVVGVHPLQRLASPEDVARVVCWLCSDEAAFITGETLYCDGGRHLTVQR